VLLNGLILLYGTRPNESKQLSTYCTMEESLDSYSSQKSPPFYATSWMTIAFKKARHWSIVTARTIPHFYVLIRILYCHLRLGLSTGPFIHYFLPESWMHFLSLRCVPTVKIRKECNMIRRSTPHTCIKVIILWHVSSEVANVLFYEAELFQRKKCYYL